MASVKSDENAKDIDKVSLNPYLVVNTRLALMARIGKCTENNSSLYTLVAYNMVLQKADFTAAKNSCEVCIEKGALCVC